LHNQIAANIIPVRLVKLEAFVRKFFLIVLVTILFLLTACGSGKTDAPAKAVEDYLNALVAKDATALHPLLRGMGR
jgi:hypothetical protein